MISLRQTKYGKNPWKLCEAKLIAMKTRALCWKAVLVAPHIQLWSDGVSWPSGNVNLQRSQLSWRRLLLSPLVAHQQLELPSPVCLSCILPPLASPPSSAQPGTQCSPLELVSACAKLVTASVGKPEFIYLFFSEAKLSNFLFCLSPVIAKEGETEGEGGRNCSIFLFVALSIANIFSAPPPYTKWRI